MFATICRSYLLRSACPRCKRNPQAFDQLMSSSPSGIFADLLFTIKDLNLTGKKGLAKGCAPACRGVRARWRWVCSAGLAVACVAPRNAGHRHSRHEGCAKPATSRPPPPAYR